MTKTPRKQNQKTPHRFAELLAGSHIRCIHLPHRVDREMIMLEAFRRLGIADRQDLFFPAIDGKKVPKPCPMPGSGTWGCALSKSAIMAEAATMNKPLLMLEDDVVINPQIHTIMDACLAELPPDWKILYLGHVALDPHDAMLTKGQPKRVVKGNHHEVLANPNLNHAILIRDTACLKELSTYLADPATYNREKGCYASDYAVAHYFANKGIPMYGVIPTVAKQCGSYSDNADKVVERNAMFEPMVPNKKWMLSGNTQFPMEWGQEALLPNELRDEGYTAAKIHPPFDLTLRLETRAQITFALLTTSRVKSGEKVVLHLADTTVCLPGRRLMVLDKGVYKITCHPEGETWRWKHVAILVKEL